MKMATGTPIIRTKEISPNIILRQIQKTPESQPSVGDRYLIVLLTWYTAKQCEVDKYCNIYHSKGFDVVQIKTKIIQFFWPNAALSYSEEILQYLLHKQYENMSFIIHGMSIGAYSYFVTLMFANENLKLYSSFPKRIAGVILDSVTVGGTDRMLEGVSISFSSNPFVRRTIRWLGWYYFWIFKSQTSDRYEDMIWWYLSGAVPVPNLFVYSMNDVMSDHCAIEAIVEHLREQGHLVHTKWWEHSGHAAHLHHHPQEYVKTIESFLKTVLSKQEIASKL